MSTTASSGHALRRDLWIAQQLRRPDLYSLTTTPELRMERQRAEIVRQGLADHRLSSRETWSQFFRRVHGEPLEVTA